MTGNKDINSLFVSVAFLGILVGAALHLLLMGIFTANAVVARADEFSDNYAAIGVDEDWSQRVAEMLCAGDRDAVSVAVAGEKYAGEDVGEWAGLLSGARSSGAAGVDAAWVYSGAGHRDYAVASVRDPVSNRLVAYMNFRFDGTYFWERASSKKWCVLHVGITPLDETAPRQP